MAAVVKGTRFQVAVGRGAARVIVERGTVQVQDTGNDLVTDIVRGQRAEVGVSQPLEVSGPGSVAVFSFDGVRVVNGTADTPADSQVRPAEQADSAGVTLGGNGNGGGNGNSGDGGRNGRKD